MNLGYACINTVLSEVKPKSASVMTNRSMIKRTFDDKGLPYASELALKNCRDLIKIVRWNHLNNIHFFRISSNLFPWASHYHLRDLPDYEAISSTLSEVGKLAKEYGQRLTSHPGPFNKLCSPKESVVINTLRDLEVHGEVFDLIGLSRTPYNKINIHVGGAYDDKPGATARFNENFMRLSESVRSRLTVENDDRASLYSTKELYSYIHKEIGIPIVFDFHHHGFCTGGQTEKEALGLAVSTWGDIKPVVHYSESRAIEQNIKCPLHAHSDYIEGPIDLHGYDVDVMIEAKRKEQALLKYRSILKDN
jgi:UV DNA damage endonuclease